MHVLPLALYQLVHSAARREFRTITAGDSTVTDARAVEHFTDCRNPMPTVEANERVCDRMEHHEDAIAAWLMDFAESKDKARYRVFEKQYLALFDQYLDEVLRKDEI